MRSIDEVIKLARKIVKTQGPVSQVATDRMKQILDLSTIRDLWGGI